jgi:hypothetical protein
MLFLTQFSMAGMYVSHLITVPVAPYSSIDGKDLDATETFLFQLSLTLKRGIVNGLFL